MASPQPPAPQALFPFPLDPFQLDAIAGLEAGRSVVVCAPTGSGKTVIGEYSIHAALAGGGRVFYTTPLKALSNQKFRDFGQQFGTGRVGLLTGDISIQRDAAIVVMTTEVFRNMLYGAGERTSLADVRFVVLDECHYINDFGRGTVWEESVICCPRRIQLVALSATIANAGQLAEWIRQAHGPTDLVYSDRRPVPLTFHYFQHGELSDLLKRRGPMSRRPLIRPGPRARPQSWQRTADPDEVVQALRERDMLPAIYFVFSRRGCERALHRCGHLDLLEPDESARLQIALGAELDRVPPLRDYPYLTELARGIAVHHAGLLPAWKGPIERLFQQALIKVVFATETLAAGINMPARTTVVSSLGKRGDTGYRTLTASEFLQMSGRAGRRGIDTLGHVVVVADPFRPAAEAVTLAESPPDPLLSRFAPTYGMVLNLLNRHSPEEAEDLLRRSFGQFLIEHGRGFREDVSESPPVVSRGRAGARGRARSPSRRESACRAMPREGRRHCVYWQRFQSLQQVLEEYLYVRDNRPTDPGRMAASLRVENELLVAEVLRSDVWDPLEPPELAGLLTAIVTEELRPDVRIHFRPDRRVLQALDAVQPIVGRLRAAQRRRRVDVATRLNPIGSGMVERWAEGAAWSQITAGAEMDEGDIVHLMRRLIDLLRQIPLAPGVDPLLAELARHATRAVDREPVNEVL